MISQDPGDPGTLQGHLAIVSSSRRSLSIKPHTCPGCEASSTPLLDRWSLEASWPHREGMWGSGGRDEAGILPRARRETSYNPWVYWASIFPSIKWWKQFLPCVVERKWVQKCLTLYRKLKQTNKKTMQKRTLRGLVTCPSKPGWDWVCRLLFRQEPRVFSIRCESLVPAKALTFHCEVTLCLSPWYLMCAPLPVLPRKQFICEDTGSAFPFINPYLTRAPPLWVHLSVCSYREIQSTLYNPVLTSNNGRGRCNERKAGRYKTSENTRVWGKL